MMQCRIAEIPYAKSVRLGLGLSQQKLSDMLGVPVRTYQEWEQGRRQPTGAAKTLLRLIARKPELLEEIDKLN